jgi:hypothetical protein
MVYHMSFFSASLVGKFNLKSSFSSIFNGAIQLVALAKPKAILSHQQDAFCISHDDS